MTILEITVDELVAVLADAEKTGESVALIDVREDDEWADGHAAAATHVPLGTVQDRLDAFGADDAPTPTYVICKAGGRSLRACEYAAAAGKNVVNVAGGMLAWGDGGHDIETGR